MLSHAHEHLIIGHKIMIRHCLPFQVCLFPPRAAFYSKSTDFLFVSVLSSERLHLIDFFFSAEGSMVTYLVISDLSLSKVTLTTLAEGDNPPNHFFH